MDKRNSKMKNIFQLSDLEYSKRKDEIMEGLEEKLSEISEVFVKSGTFYGSQHIKNHLKERVKRIKEIVNKRLNLDIHYIQKSKISFNDDIYQEINKRVLDAIESEIESARDKMLHFCRNWPSSKSYLELINQELDNKKYILIKNVERDILIHNMKSELEVKKNIKKPKIFLSYSHKNKEIADRVDKFFISKNIRLTRDVRDAPAYSSLKKFMDTIRDHDYVILLISDVYLKSINCMYEVIQFIQEKKYIEKTFPIIIDKQADIFNKVKHIDYISFWQNRYKRFRNKINKLENTGTAQSHVELDKIDRIQSNIGEFLNKIADLKCFPLDELESTNYKAILDKIGNIFKIPQKEEIGNKRENLKLKIIGCLYKWYIEGIEEPSKLMNILIDEAIDDGYLKRSSFGYVKLTKEGRLFARKEKLEKKYNCKECGKGD